MTKSVAALFKMAKIDANLLLSKFRGSLLGSLVGDCLGAPYEGDTISPGDKILIQRYFDTLELPNFKGPIRQYTDDTAMMKSVGKTLIDNPEVDYVYLAKLFVKEYFIDPKRGYGQNVVEVFNKLRKTKFQDVYKPASEQFEGSGSYGNGGGMRIAPVALFFHDNYSRMVDVARKSTQITHTHLLGLNGAILQSIAIWEASHCDPNENKIEPSQFLNNLREKICIIEQNDVDGLGLDDGNPYELKLKTVGQLLKENYHDGLDEEVINELGNSIAAYDSVPTAIYCFLRALNDIPTVKTDNVFRRAIQYAITLGGDTDTIACMAGAIAGAYLGDEAINKNLIRHCEFRKDIIEMANELFKCSKYAD